MQAPRLLAITPPTGPVDPSCVERWLEPGLTPELLYLLLREPGASPGQLLSADGRLGPLRRRAQASGLRVLLSVEREHFESGEVDPAVPPEGIHGYHLRGRPDHAGTTVETGRSAHNDDLTDPQKVAALNRLATSYWTFAPVFTPSAASYASPQPTPKSAVGLDALNVASLKLQAPLLALGGVGADRVQSCLDAGAYGVAGIGCFFGAPAAVAHHARTFHEVLQGVLAQTSKRTRDSPTRRS